MSREKKESKGQRMVRELRDLADVLKSGRPLTSHYTVRTCRRLVEPTEYDPQHVRRTRQAMGVSQTVFADMVGVSESLVQSWEQGFRRPSKMACRLLDELNRNRDHWRGLLASA
ncbi:MAG: helix-turn-helix domain-containing protein [Tepidisphaerales bacterium]